MATIPIVKTVDGDHSKTLFWETLTESDTCAAYQLPRPAFGVAYEANGTWGGATLALQGSIDGTTYFSLPDVAGSAVALTADGGGQAFGMVNYIRPSASGGTAQDLDITLLIYLGPERSA